MLKKNRPILYAIIAVFCIGFLANLITPWYEIPFIVKVRYGERCKYKTDNKEKNRYISENYNNAIFIDCGMAYDGNAYIVDKRTSIILKSVGGI